MTADPLPEIDPKHLPGCGLAFDRETASGVVFHLLGTLSEFGAGYQSPVQGISAPPSGPIGIVTGHNGNLNVLGQGGLNNSPVGTRLAAARFRA